MLEVTLDAVRKITEWNVTTDSMFRRILAPGRGLFLAQSAELPGTTPGKNATRVAHGLCRGTCMSAVPEGRGGETDTAISETNFCRVGFTPTKVPARTRR